MARKNELLYPEIFSNEFVVNIENVRFVVRTQKASPYDYILPKPGRNHFHSGYEIFLCDKGEVSVNIEDRVISLKRGDLLVVPPKIAHSCSARKEGGCQISLLFDFLSNGQKSTCDLHRLVSKIIGDSVVVIPGMAGLAESLRKINRVSEENDSYNLSRYVHVLLNEMIELSGNVPENREGVCIDNTDLRYRKILLFVDNHLGEQITLRELAAGLRLSTRQVSRIIKENFGCSFKELVTKFRMEKAGELMLRTNYKVSEISEMVGYSSERGFYEAFKNNFGCLPKEYRKKIAHKS